MKNINIVYDEVYNDVDIIAVPESLLPHLNAIIREFLDWLPTAPAEDTDYWVVEDGYRCSNCETTGLIKWINKKHSKNQDSVVIVRQHTDYCPQYPRIDF